MAREIERDHLPTRGEQRRERLETARVVEPAMQREQRRKLRIPPASRGQRRMRQRDAQFLSDVHRAGVHAAGAPPRAAPHCARRPRPGRTRARPPGPPAAASHPATPPAARAEASAKAEGLSQEELLKQPVHISHRPLKDPREIRLLDPACGSMHFGLYAFDLFETIYEEAWDNGSCPTLQEAYTSKDALLLDVPRLIIEHNIHGIDIDPRAVQIAGLSLWLRAQKAWQQQKVPAADRITIVKELHKTGKLHAKLIVE